MNASPDGVNDRPRLTKEHKLAIEQFCARRVVPLLFEEKASVDQTGSGILLDHNSRLFLITAKHVLEGSCLNSISIPRSRSDANLRTLGRSIFIRPKDADIDVGLLEVCDEEVKRDLRTNWDALAVGDLYNACPTGDFLVAGYPSARTKMQGENLFGTLVSVYSQRVADPLEVTTETFDPKIDLFFYLDRKSPLLDGTLVSVPSLRGMSGGPVWQIDYRPQGIWTPKNSLKYVGVQSAELIGKYFRAQSASVVAMALKRAVA